MKKWRILSICLFFIICVQSKGLSQWGAYINGPSSVLPNDQSYYSASFDYWPPYVSNITWTVIGGTIIDQNTNTNFGTIYCVIQWDNAPGQGYVAIYEDLYGQYGELYVSIGDLFDPGAISTSNQYFNYTSSIPSINEIAASGGSCGGQYNYVWERSLDGGVNWTAIGNGQIYPSVSLTNNCLIRRRVDCGTTTGYSNNLEFLYRATNWENRNYIRTNDIWYAGKTTFVEADNQPIGPKQQTTIFYDGLGRPEQTVIMGASPNNKDLVSPVEYDALGRELNKHLAYQAGTGDGKFKSNALSEQQTFMNAKYSGENHFYAETKIEESPLNRAIKVLAPGLNWGGNNVGISTGYELNKTIDAVRIWKIDNFSSSALPISNASDVYTENALYKVTTTDERGKRIIEYRDKDGMIILRKQQKENAFPALDENHKGWLCTYYVYDDYGRLRYMISPKAVKQMDDASNWVLTQQMADGLCYKYVYDGRGRVIEKKLPDADPTYMVYDSRDRLAFSQDGNQRAGRTNSFGFHEWTFFIYDAQNRQIVSGIMIDDNNYTRQYLQSVMNDPVFYSAEKTITVQTDVSEQLIAFNPVPIFIGNGNFIDYYQVKFNAVNYYDQNQGAYNGGTLGYATGFENIDPQTPSYRVTGLLTAVKVRVLDGGNAFRKSITIYDEKGRVIQTSNKNSLNYDVTLINQYDFAGKLRSTLYTESKSTLIISQPFPQYAYETFSILSKYEIDHVGRARRTIKNVTRNTWSDIPSENPLTITTGERTVVEHSYDDLGQLLSKTLAPGYNGPNGAFIEKLDYEYNIRGWMTGINKAYVSSSSSSGRFFGMELGFDKPGNAGFINTLMNGNVAGMAWKTAGDNVARKFDYQYDNANRLISADFNQKNTAGANWTKDKFDFSVPVIQYDANGNISRMEQQGVNFSGIVPMDKMSYGYDSYSNKLNWVTDDAGSVEYKLGDFTDKNSGIGNLDFTYDENGNLNKDNNKEISSISYNYLNLPELITITGKGTIRYIYDAAGNKLQKVVTDNTPTTGQVVTTTTYSGPMVYTGNDFYISFEEGRVRYAKTATTTQPTAFTFDYFIKDHLGNVRMILTEENQVNPYPVATMETATSALEDKYYKISNRTDKPVELQGNSQYDERYGQKMSKLSSLGSNNRIGPSILLKVMAGDVLQARTDYYYKDNGTQINSTSLLNDLATNLLIHLNAGQAGATAKHQSGIIGSSVQGDGVVNSLISTQNSSYPGDKPKAYLNYIVFNERFEAVSKGFKLVENNGPLQPALVLNDIAINQNGWIYVFVNNESQQAVYFDNFQVLHTRGNILEETHYYPFGLAMKMISPRALSVNPINWHKYSDKELQSEEFSDGSGLEEYDFGVRYFDPQIGRWNGLDPMAEKFPNLSPYNYSANNPVLFVDKDGKFVHLILKYGVNVAINIGVQMITAYMFDPSVKSWGDAWDEVSIWDALWESASDMIGSRALKMAGNAIVGIFHYIDDVGFKNVTGTGLLQAGAMGILEPIVARKLASIGFKGMKYALKKIGFDAPAISKMLMNFTGKNAPKNGSGLGKQFKPFTKDNYRENLKIWTGKPGTPFEPGSAFQAHHVFPQEFETVFKKYGIDVHKPQFMQWWSSDTHQLFSYEYQQAWTNYLSNPNNKLDTNSILAFGRSLMSNYGLSTWF
jgi:RHS repeat-associated protein